jgi:hypothetical protein
MMDRSFIVIDAVTDGDACLGDVVADAQVDVYCLALWEVQVF